LSKANLIIKPNKFQEKSMNDNETKLLIECDWIFQKVSGNYSFRIFHLKLFWNSKFFETSSGNVTELDDSRY
jgi:hypothetical protein